MTPTDALIRDALAEAVDLHAFFEAWLTGRVPRTPALFGRCAAVLAPGFRQVVPAGAVRGRAELLDGLERAHGSLADLDPPFGIWIDQAEVWHLVDGHCLVAYREWQRRGDLLTGRQSTALFRRRGGTPFGVEWLHVHETWLPASVVDQGYPPPSR